MRAKLLTTLTLLVLLAVVLFACSVVPGSQPNSNSNLPPAASPTAAAPLASQPQPTLEPTLEPTTPPTEVVVAAASATAPATSQAAAPSAAAVTQQGVSEPISLTQLSMVTASEGWAVAKSGQVLHTTSGPAAWQDVSPQYPSAENLQVAAGFLRQEPLSALVAAHPATSGDFTVFRTTDAGKKWSTATFSEANLEGEIQLTQVYMLDDQHAWILGQIYPGMNHVYTIIYSSQDGGQTWKTAENTFTQPTRTDLLPGAYSLSFGEQLLAFTSPQVGFAGTGSLMKTTDGGASWNKVELPKGPNYPKLTEPYEYVQPPRFTSDKEGAFLMSVYEYSDVYNPPGDMFGAAPKALYVYTTSDGGQTWTPTQAPVKLGTLFFLDGKNGWLLGKDDTNPAKSASLYQTQNGGQTWTMLAQTGLPLGSSLQFTDAQHAFAYNDYVLHQADPYSTFDSRATNQGYLFSSADGGKSWSQVKVGVSK